MNGEVGGSDVLSVVNTHTRMKRSMHRQKRNARRLYSENEPMSTDMHIVSAFVLNAFELFRLFEQCPRHSNTPFSHPLRAGNLTQFLQLLYDLLALLYPLTGTFALP
jgi:hypothetical protein